MPGIARKTDQISHGGTIIEGSASWLVNGLGVARVGDKVLCALHGQQTIVSGSPDVRNEGKPVARVGDAISCSAVITSGSLDTRAN